MNQKGLYAGIGFVIGILITIFVTSITNPNRDQTQNVVQTKNEHTKSDTSKIGAHTMSMDDMVMSLHGKTGDDFDKAFISGMIEHHQGAIDMANLAKQHAKHDEIKSMADAIISAQTTEIDQMRKWQEMWGY